MSLLPLSCQTPVNNSNTTLIILDTSGKEPAHYPIAQSHTVIEPHSSSVITILSDSSNPIPFNEFRAALSVKLEDDSNVSIMLN